MFAAERILFFFSLPEEISSFQSQGLPRYSREARRSFLGRQPFFLLSAEKEVPLVPPFFWRAAPFPPGKSGG